MIKKIIAGVFVLSVLLISPSVSAQEITLDESEYTLGSTSEFAESAILGEQEALADTGNSQMIWLAASGVLGVTGAISIVYIRSSRSSYLAKR